MPNAVVPLESLVIRKSSVLESRCHAGSSIHKALRKFFQATVAWATFSRSLPMHGVLPPWPHLRPEISFHFHVSILKVCERVC